DDLERAGDRAVLSVIVTLQHAFQSIVSISCFTQPGQVASATRGPPCSPATACPGLGFGSLNQPAAMASGQSRFSAQVAGGQTSLTAWPKHAATEMSRHFKLFGRVPRQTGW